MTEPRSHEIERRTILQGAAWSIPVFGVAASVPMASASGLCSTTVTSNAVAVPGNPAEYTFPVPGTTDAYTLIISSTLGPSTTTTQNGASYNMGDSGSGWNGEAAPDGSNDYVFSGFGADGALTLNQRVTGTTAPTATTSPSQTLTFQFTAPDGNSFNPTNFQMTIFDISSVADSGWRATYWDAVGFSTTPDSIVAGGIALPGSGAGTLSDPYHRTTGNEYTPAEGQNLFDEFAFSSFPSGTSMVYTQFGGAQGWQFISLAEMSFDVPIAC